MNLIVDVGNTQVKLAVFNNDKLIYDTATGIPDFLKDIRKIAAEFPEIRNGIISNVGNMPEESIGFLEKQYNIHILTSSTNVPFKNKYTTPQTLGVDRIALISAAFKNYSKQNVLVIDAGSCITYDFLNNKGEYLGGAISPGLAMRYKALNSFTAGLPLIKNENLEDFIGKNTKTAIVSGVQNGVILEIDAVIDQYLQRFEDLTVILTGGDMQFLSKRLKNTIFANPKILLEGLNYILEHIKHG